MRALEARRKRRRNWMAAIGVAAAVIIAAVGITLAVTSGNGSNAVVGGTPQLKLASLTPLGTLKLAPSPGPVGSEGIPVPADVGIPARAQNGPCLYWLHTHAPDGIIHVESPAQRTYTLGDFFDEWGQPLGPHQVGPAKGPVVAIYNGQHYEGNPRNIPLNAHAQIQLEVGTPLIAPVSVTFPSSL